MVYTIYHEEINESSCPLFIFHGVNFNSWFVKGTDYLTQKL
jgi:hypothetical protein